VTSTRSLCHCFYAACYLLPLKISAVSGPETHSHLPHPLALDVWETLRRWHFFSFSEAAFLLLIFQHAEKEKESAPFRFVHVHRMASP
jgi:hypothetical protein